MMRELKQLDRRGFLQLAGTAAACGLAATSSAAALASAPLIDTHVYLGHWPLRHIPADSPAKLVALLRRAGVTQAWSGTFEGLFHKDVYGANSRLVEACRNAGDGFMIPIGTVNPTLPDWEEDVRRCHESFKMPGIRLHPNYHGYALDDPRFARLLELAAARGLFVQLVAQMSDDRQRLLAHRIAHVDLAPLVEVVQPIHNLRLLIASAKPAALHLMNALLVGPGVYVNVAPAYETQVIRKLVDSDSVNRIVFGSVAPLLDVSPSTGVLRQAKLTAEQNQAICSGNAERLAR